MAFLPVTPENDTVYGILDYYTAFDGNVAANVAAAKAETNQKNALDEIKAAADTVLQTAMTVPMGSEKSVFYYENYYDNLYIDPFTSVINLKHATVK